MRTPRITLGRLMIGVAVVALGLGATFWGRAMWGRSRVYQAVAARHVAEEVDWLNLVAHNDAHPNANYTPEERAWFRRGFRALADHHAALAAKYRRAAGRPWDAVAADPPEPPWPALDAPGGPRFGKGDPEIRPE